VPSIGAFQQSSPFVGSVRHRVLLAQVAWRHHPRFGTPVPPARLEARDEQAAERDKEHRHHNVDDGSFGRAPGVVSASGGGDGAVGAACARAAPVVARPRLSDGAIWCANATALGRVRTARPLVSSTCPASIKADAV